MKRPKIKNITIKKKHFKTFIHLNFISGFLYAFYHYARTPKSVDMPTRRLWAAETWIIFTLYSIFIYLFSLEVASENGEPLLRKLFKIRRSIVIRKSKKEMIDVFDYIQNNPNKYSFKTHRGIFPVKGKFTSKGSVFQTKERFGFLPITLTFTTIGKTEDGFEFKLTKPLKNLEVLGEFNVREIGENKSRLFLSVYSENDCAVNHILLAFIFISPTRMLISNQLNRELKFIRRLTTKIS
jgi:hypothetical protein